MKYELNYMNSGRDCGYCHESDDFNELQAELDELHQDDLFLCKLFEGFWSYCTIELIESGKVMLSYEMSN